MGQIVACYRKGGCTPEGIPINPPPEYWGVSPDQSQEVNDRLTKNGQLIWDTLSKYPYPAPFDPGEGVSFFLKFLKQDLQELAASTEELDADAIRLWATLEVMGNYNAWTEMMQANAERMAKRRKKVALRSAIAVTIGSLVVGVAAPAAIAAIFAAVRTATQTYIDLQKAKEAAQALNEAAKAFSESDPEFAKELSRAQDVMDLIAAGRTSPDGIPGVIAQAEAPKSNTVLVVGGGLVAVGLAAFAIFR